MARQPAKDSIKQATWSTRQHAGLWHEALIVTRQHAEDDRVMPAHCAPHPQ